MSYTRGRVVHDADSHVMETRDWLAPFTEAEFKSKIPSLGEGFGRLESIIETAKQRKSDPIADAKAAEEKAAADKAAAEKAAADKAAADKAAADKAG